MTTQFKTLKVSALNLRRNSEPIEAKSGQANLEQKHYSELGKERMKNGQNSLFSLFVVVLGAFNMSLTSTQLRPNPVKHATAETFRVWVSSGVVFSKEDTGRRFSLVNADKNQGTGIE